MYACIHKMKYRCGMRKWIRNTKRSQVGKQGESFPSNHVDWETERMLIKVVYQDSGLLRD